MADKLSNLYYRYRGPDLKSFPESADDNLETYIKVEPGDDGVVECVGFQQSLAIEHKAIIVAPTAARGAASRAVKHRLPWTEDHSLFLAKFIADQYAIGKFETKNLMRFLRQVRLANPMFFEFSEFQLRNEYKTLIRTYKKTTEWIEDQGELEESLSVGVVSRCPFYYIVEPVFSVVYKTQALLDPVKPLPKLRMKENDLLVQADDKDGPKANKWPQQVINTLIEIMVRAHRRNELKSFTKFFRTLCRYNELFKDKTEAQLVNFNARTKIKYLKVKRLLIKNGLSFTDDSPTTRSIAITRMPYFYELAEIYDNRPNENSCVVGLADSESSSRFKSNGETPTVHKIDGARIDAEMKLTSERLTALVKHVVIAAQQMEPRKSILDYVEKLPNFEPLFEKYNLSDMHFAYSELKQRHTRTRLWIEEEGYSIRNSDPEKFKATVVAMFPDYFLLEDTLGPDYQFESNSESVNTDLMDNFDEEKTNMVFQNVETRGYPELFECNHCTALFRNRSQMSQHFSECHTYDCAYCNTRLHGKADYVQHLSSHFSCRRCTSNLRLNLPNTDLEYSSRSGAMEDDDLLDCNDDSEDHTAIRIPLKKILIDPESNPSKRKARLKSVHTKKQQSVGIKRKYDKKTEPKVCTICGDLVPHYRMAFHLYKHDHTSFKCKLCDKTFKHSSSVGYHMQAAHSDKIICSYCGEYFTTRQVLTRHIRTKHSEETFPCDQCDRIFNDKVHRRSHIRRVHLKILKHACSFCEKRFFSRCHLQKHEHTHTGVKPYVCKLNCGAAFNQPHLVGYHMRKVHGWPDPKPSDTRGAGDSKSSYQAKRSTAQVKTLPAPGETLECADFYGFRFNTESKEFNQQPGIN